MALHLLRYDDYSSRSSLAVEYPLVELIGQLSYPCTFSVIPFVLDGTAFSSSGRVEVCALSREKVQLIRGLVDSGTIEIALHGWSHIALSPLRDLAEFSDTMPVETQRSLIRDGRNCLEDLFQRKISLFVPPWNRLGISTIEALKAEEMLCVSAGYPSHWEAASPLGADAAEPMRSVPCWLELATIRRSLECARLLGGKGAILGTLIHDYDFTESGYRIAAISVTIMRDILSELLRRPDLRHMHVGAAAEMIGPSSQRRLQMHIELGRLYQRGFLRRRVWGRYLRSAYWETPELQKLSLAARIMSLGRAGSIRPDAAAA